MAQPLSAHNPRIARVRELREKKTRCEHQAFAFEGATLLHEARRSGFPVDELYATQKACDEAPALRELEASGTPLFIVDERTFEKISDVETPSGILAVSRLRYAALETILVQPGVALVLADLNDPGNAGTLLRSADAFGASGVIFGSLGVDPYHPKAIRAAMGAIFRLPLALADPEQLREAAQKAGTTTWGLDSSGENISGSAAEERLILVVGHERHGLGRWAPICTRTVAIPMPGAAESLNASVAGSIALYEFSRR